MNNLSTYAEDLRFAFEAAETAATNTDLLAVLMTLNTNGTEAADIITVNIALHFELAKNESFKRHMQNEFTYYANITPRPIWAKQKMQVLENIWEMIYHI